MAEQKKRIAIIGGGPSGLSTAFHLTSPEYNPNWKDEYEVDVYTMGWRIGGKGATGRRADVYHRLQEHGIHVFGNMYYNSLTMVSQALDELRTSDPTVPTMAEAFLPSELATGVHWLPHPTATEEGFKVDGHWAVRRDPTPFSEGLPWEHPRHADPKRIVEEALSMVQKSLVVDANRPVKGGFFHRLLATIRRDAAREVIRVGTELEQHLFREREDRHHPGGHPRHHALLEFLDKEVVALLDDIRKDLPGNVDAHANYCNANLVSATLRGLVEEDLINRGLDSADDLNYDRWLAKYGCSEYTLRSAMPQVIPNTALSYAKGDTTKIPTMAASAYLEFFCRQMSGKGHFAYFFREGTGETIMRPLYQVLVQRGVRFHFFHKLSAVVPGTREVIERFEFDLQATPIGGVYDPLVAFRDEKVWPDRPVYERLVEGPRLQQGTEIPNGGYDLESWWTAWKPVGTRTLEVGRDFDIAVLATPVSTLPYTCQAVMAHPGGKRFADAVANSHTAASQALQLWLDKTPEELGLMVHVTKDSPGNRALGPSFGQDLNCYCDFTDLIQHEGWDEHHRPKALFYMIGVLQDPEEIPDFDDHGYPERMYQRALWAAAAQLRGISGLLPGATDPDVDYRSLDFSILHDDSGAEGLNRLASQYLKVNIDPNERYTISLPGCLKYRLKGWESGFENLALAGDWVYSGFNVGSFEGAVMSGKLASLAVAGAPTIDHIWTYTFMNPDRKGPQHRILDRTPVAGEQPLADEDA